MFVIGGYGDRRETVDEDLRAGGFDSSVVATSLHARDLEMPVRSSTPFFSCQDLA